MEVDRAQAGEEDRKSNTNVPEGSEDLMPQRCWAANFWMAESFCMRLALSHLKRSAAAEVEAVDEEGRSEVADHRLPGADVRLVGAAIGSCDESGASIGYWARGRATKGGVAVDARSSGDSTRRRFSSGDAISSDSSSVFTETIRAYILFVVSRTHIRIC